MWPYKYFSFTFRMWSQYSLFVATLPRPGSQEFVVTISTTVLHFFICCRCCVHVEPRLAPRHVTHEVLLQLRCVRKIRQSPNLLKTPAGKGFIQSVHKKLLLSPQQLMLSFFPKSGRRKTCILVHTYMGVGIAPGRRKQKKSRKKRPRQQTARSNRPKL